MARGPRIGRTDAVDSDVIEHSTFIAILRWANKPTWLVWCVCVCVCVCFCLTPFLGSTLLMQAFACTKVYQQCFSKLNHSSFPMHSRAIPCFCICCFYDL